MTTKILLEFAVVIAAILVGSRFGGIALGLWGGAGVLVLSLAFGLPPTSPPIDVMLIILAVIMATSAMEAAGGIDWLVGIAEGLIRRNPKRITIVAPVVSWLFTLGAGTGHVFYPLLPVIHEVAHENGIRPERPIAVSTIASQQAITASPVSAATAAMIALFDPAGIRLPGIIAVAIPATLVGVIVAALVQTRVGKELSDDPEYRRRLSAGEIEPPKAGREAAQRKELPKTARVSALMFLLGVALVVAAGLFPALRPTVLKAGKSVPLDMATTIQVVMLTMAALILAVARVPAGNIPKTASSQAGMTAVVGIFGLAWLGDTFIKANEKLIIGQIGDLTAAHPAVFAGGLFLASILLFSQAVTTRALMPLGISLGLPPSTLIASWPAVNGYFFLPTYGTLIAAINFDRTGTTRIGRFVLNHSFMLPGLVATCTAVAVGLVLGKLFF